MAWAKGHTEVGVLFSFRCDFFGHLLGPVWQNICTFLIIKRLSEQPTQAASSHTVNVCQQLVVETWKAAETKLFQLPLVSILSKLFERRP